MAALALTAADVNQDLLDASRQGDLADVKGLIEKGAALESKTAYGQTPLYLAAMNGHEEVVRFLLDKGAVADVQDTFYKAPRPSGIRSRRRLRRPRPPTAKWWSRISVWGAASSPVIHNNTVIVWSKQRGGVYLPSPIVYGDQLYTVGNNGVMTAYEARTGNHVYQQRIGTGGSFSASPVAADGKLYMASEDGDIFVIKAGAQYELMAKNPIGEPMIATPAWAGDVLIVRGARHLFAIAETGR